MSSDALSARVEEEKNKRMVSVARDMKPFA
jgi:hypothetical protein